MWLLDYLYPLCCPHCGRELTGPFPACRGCYRQLRRERISPSGTYCPICSFPLFAGACRFCRERNLFFAGHSPLFRMNSDWNRLLRKWKFENERRLYRIFLPSARRLMRQKWPNRPHRIGVIDSGRAGLDVRFYSPCGDVARRLAADFGIPFGRDLRKKKRFRQSKGSYARRFVQIRGNLAPGPDHSGITAGPYLLIEDLFTTGSTANEAARILKGLGAGPIHVLSLLLRDEWIGQEEFGPGG